MRLACLRWTACVTCCSSFAGSFFPATVGEVLYTSFNRSKETGWTLTMGAVNDPSRTSTLVVAQPYMGLGKHWPTPSTSWSEANYTNLCINACWELYGAGDREHLPGSGSQYNLFVKQGKPKSFPWVAKWDQDEGGNKPCPSSTIAEHHTDVEQHVQWNISLTPK